MDETIQKWQCGALALHVRELARRESRFPSRGHDWDGTFADGKDEILAGDCEDRCLKSP